MSKTWKDAYDPSWKRGDNYYGNGKKLTSLEGAPSHVDGDFRCDNNNLTSLKGAPARVEFGFFDCRSNKITTLEGAPSFIDGSFYCSSNKLTSLKDIHLQIEYVGNKIFLHDNPIESHVLGVLLIEGLKKVTLDNTVVQNILNKYLPSKGIESALLAQDELIVAGFEEYAQL